MICRHRLPQKRTTYIQTSLSLSLLFDFGFKRETRWMPYKIQYCCLLMSTTIFSFIIVYHHSRSSPWNTWRKQRQARIRKSSYIFISITAFYIKYGRKKGFSTIWMIHLVDRQLLWIMLWISSFMIQVCGCRWSFRCLSAVPIYQIDNSCAQEKNGENLFYSLYTDNRNNGKRRRSDLIWFYKRTQQSFICPWFRWSRCAAGTDAELYWYSLRASSWSKPWDGDCFVCRGRWVRRLICRIKSKKIYVNNTKHFFTGFTPSSYFIDIHL